MRRLLLVQLSIWAVLLSVQTSCGKEAKTAATPEPEVASPATTTTAAEEADPDKSVPQVGAISLSNLGMADSMSLADEEEDDDNCGQQESLGVFGMALGGACHTAPLAAEMMLGENPDTNDDGVVDCSDLSDDSTGILLHLLCEETLKDTPKVKTIAFSEPSEDDPEEEEAVFISFEKLTGMPMEAAGSWTAGSSTSYPAHISVQMGADMDNLAGVMALGLKSLDEGRVYVNVEEGDFQLHGRVDFKNSSDTANCEADFSKCHQQEIRLYTGEGELMGPPNGFHLSVYADKKDKPEFIALEGKYRYTEEGAASAFGENSDMPALQTIREIYFVAVQKGDQIWGKFNFRNGDGDLISAEMNGIDIFEHLSQGVCQNLGDDSWVDCEDIDASDYADLWVGEDDYDLITASPSADDGITFPDKPEKTGVCDVNGTCVDPEE